MTGNTPLTLPIAELPLIMDYARLRAEGIRLLGQLAGTQWTDFNVHDPGVTILEQLCYAITDLGYRIHHPMADLLAEGGSADLPGPREMLAADPVTAEDLRRWLLARVPNAWVEEAAPPTELYYEAEAGTLWLQREAVGPDARAVRLRGISRVLLEPGFASLSEVARAPRLLGQDVEVAWLREFGVTLSADIEVEATDDPVGLLADVIDHIGASLRHGRPSAAGVLERPKTIHVSQLIHAITDTARVRAVRKITLASDRSPADSGAWALEIPTEHVAKLSRKTELRLFRAGLPLEVELDDAWKRIDDSERARRPPAPLQPPTRAPGRARAAARYRSIQRQLPAAYGVGRLAWGAGAPARRRAQAQQLRAYLLIFDQLLANCFAQLAHAHELLSPGPGSRSYFAQPVDDAPLPLAESIELEPAAYAAWLDDQVQRHDKTERRKRFVAHLLARYGEQLDHAVDLKTRQEFLRDYPRTSRARGSGADFGADPGAVTAVEQRIRLRLGADAATRFHLVERVLLRPIAEDLYQLDSSAANDAPIPLLAGVNRADPWSLQLDFVFEGVPTSVQEQRVAAAIVAETPAHLLPRLCWLSAEDWQAFEDAWQGFRGQLASHRSGKQSATPTRLEFRDARDRVIDRLGFARTYPLRGLPMEVTPGKRVELAFSQRGVVYELYVRARDAESGRVVFAANGTGGALGLRLDAKTLPEPYEYRVWARKFETTGDAPAPGTWLHGAWRPG
jgi:hypothetical protein